MEQKKRIEVKIKSYDLPSDASETAAKKEETAANSVQNNHAVNSPSAEKKKFVVNIKDYDEFDEPATESVESRPVKAQKVSARPAAKPYELEDTVARIIREVDENKEKKEQPNDNAMRQHEDLAVPVAALPTEDLAEVSEIKTENTIDAPKKAEKETPKKSNTAKTSDKKKTSKEKKKYEPKSPVARFFKKFIPWAGDSAGETIRKMVLITAFIIAVACIYIIVKYYASSTDSKEKNDNLTSMHQQLEAENEDVSQPQEPIITDDEDYIPPMIREQIPFYEMNNDVVGWIEIENTRVNLPILQGETNDEYHSSDINGKPDEYGCIYIDYRCRFTHNEQSDNLVIYGHDTKTNSMFGDLDQYKPSFGTIRFLKEHPVIKLDSNYYRSEYVIFAVIITNAHEKDGEVWPYHNEIEFTDELDFQTFISNAKKRSMYDTGIDVEYGEKLVTLSTCATDFEDSRLVVIARELREGETGYDYIDNYEYNENPLYPDTWYRYRGGRYDDTDTRYDIETLFGSAE